MIFQLSNLSVNVCIAGGYSLFDVKLIVWGCGGGDQVFMVHGKSCQHHELSQVVTPDMISVCNNF